LLLLIYRYKPLLSPSPTPTNLYAVPDEVTGTPTLMVLPERRRSHLSIVPTQATVSPWMVFAAGAFLVSVPVFFEAPLVRYWPGASLALSLVWAGLSVVLCQRRETRLWGDLAVGFTWSWLCGSIFWGWLRWFPEWHLPIEALALPIALWGLRCGWAKVGNCFYLGSLLGTAITDIYFYIVDLIPAWKQLMVVDPAQAGGIFELALAKMYMPWGMAWTAILLTSLLFFGLWGLTRRSAQWMAFSGAVLSTILVDGLFWVAATFS
jgi:Protein of unknown function (DUF3120)